MKPRAGYFQSLLVQEFCDPSFVKMQRWPSALSKTPVKENQWVWVVPNSLRAIWVSLDNSQLSFRFCQYFLRNPRKDWWSYGKGKLPCFFFISHSSVSVSLDAFTSLSVSPSLSHVFLSFPLKHSKCTQVIFLFRDHVGNYHPSIFLWTKKSDLSKKKVSAISWVKYRKSRDMGKSWSFSA